MTQKDDIRFMKEAIKLASKVRPGVSPDPAVGAIIVKNGKIVGRGYHDKFATPHAEEFAIRNAGKNAIGATLYINLEPCCHYGNNPPCTENIIRSKIKRVVASMKDPNPLVCGNGFKALKKAGIRVEVGIMESESVKLNEAFIKHITTGLPFVTLKMAMSLDGKIATKSGDSKWISSQRSREKVHGMREHSDAVMIGIGTALRDNPLLTSRKKMSPIRVIVDPSAALPLNSRLLKDRSAQTYVAVSRNASAGKVAALEKAGARIIKAGTRGNNIVLKDVLKALGKEKISSVLLEGGGNMAAGALKEGLVDKVIFFISPKIIGGKDAPTPVEGTGIDIVSKAMTVRDVEVKLIGEDIMIEGYMIKKGKIK